MKKGIRIFLGILLGLLIIVLASLYLSQRDIVVLNPKGLIGVKQKDLFWISTLLMLIVVIPVFVLTIWAVWKYRAGHDKQKYDPEWNHSTVAEIIWWGIPFVIVVILSVLNWIACYELDPFRPIASDKKTLTIQVVALEWKWLFIYPDQKIATVNFIQIPLDTPVQFVITADAPMNSFWIPQLGGQIFAMPAMRTELHLIANEKGDYRGVSAHLSGKGFSGMTFTVRAGNEEEFKAFVEEAKNAPQELDLTSYKMLAKPSKNNPFAFYKLGYEGLFDWIVMKYMTPEQEMQEGRLHVQ